MSNPLTDLNQLVELAHEHTDEDSRRDLLRRVTDVFLGGPGSYTEMQNEYFGDIMETLAYDLERQVREELARQIAAETDAPRKLVKRLAGDEIAVAQPVLEQSPVLTEDDLIDLSQRSGQEHLLAITKRSDISANLSTVLVHRGQDDVVESLVRNEAAEIAPEDVQNVANRAKISEKLQSALIDRQDVPRTALIDLIEHVSDKLKHTFLDTLTDADEEKLDDIVRSIRADIETSEKSDAERHVEDLWRRRALNEHVLLRFAFEKKSMEFLLGLAKLLNIDFVTAQRVVQDKTGQALIVACRASGFSVEAFKEIALSPVTGIAANLREVLPLTRAYQRLTEANARGAMQFWQERKLKRQ